MGGCCRAARVENKSPGRTRARQPVVAAVGGGGLLRHYDVLLDSTLAFEFNVDGFDGSAVHQLLGESAHLLGGDTHLGGDFARDERTVGKDGEHFALDTLVGYLLFGERVAALVVASVEFDERVLCEHDNLVGDFVVENGCEEFAISHMTLFLPHLRGGRDI